MTRVFAVILAGGEGSRLGHVRKGELRVGGMRMVDRVVAALAGVEPGLLVSTGQSQACPLPAPALSLPDLVDHATGPLAGLRAASAYLAGRAAPEDVLISVAVDTPFLPHDFVSRLVTATQDADAAFAIWGANFYPTNSAWRLGALGKTLDRLDDSEGPRAALRLLHAVRVDWATESEQDPFANANSLADLLALQRRALGA